MVALINLPAYQVPNALNFQPLADAIDANRRDQQNNRLLALKEQAHELDRERFGLQKRSADLDHSQRIAQSLASVAELAAGDPQKWQRLVASHPQFANQLRAYGVDPSDHINGPKFVIAQARGYQDPNALKMQEAELAAKRAQTSLYGAHADLYRAQTEAARARPSDTFDLGPDHVRYRMRPDGTAQEIARGGTKMDPTTKKEIAEADDFVMQNQAALGAIKEALQLNEKAYDGAVASGRAAFVNNTISTESARATALLENVVTNQALQSLRSTFGGNPTEGERKILLEVAGSVNQPRKVREEIYKRAQAAAERRLEFNRRKASAMRTGDYFSPGYTPPQFDDRASPPGGGHGQIPPAAVEFLRQNANNPSIVQQFEQKYGPGSARAFLMAR